MLKTRSLRAAVLLCTLLAGYAAQAQTARSGGGASAQMAQQLQQLASERTAMQAELDHTKKELEDTRKERDELKKGQQALDQRAKASTAALAQSASQRTASEQELTQTKAKMQELIAKFRETVQAMRQIEAEGTTAKQTLATRDRQLKVCVDRNTGLYDLNKEILSRWDHESAFTRAERIESFTKIKRVQLDNLMDDYQGRADDLHVTPEKLEKLPAAPAAPPGPPSAAPTPAPQASPAPQPTAPPTGPGH